MKLITVLLRLLLFPITIANLCISKEGWVFGSLRGISYNDNSKYLFEYVSKHTDEKAVWLSSNMSVVREIRNNGLEAHRFYSWRGIRYALFTKYVVLSHSYNDVSMLCYLFPLKSKIIQLYHGTPLKRLDIEKHRSIINKLVRYLLWAYIGKKYDIVACASQESLKKFQSFFQIEREDVFAVTGYPRNDALLQRQDEIVDSLGLEKYKKFVLYMPTYRQQGHNQNGEMNETIENSKELEDVLLKHNAVFLCKLHVGDFEEVFSHKQQDASRSIKYINNRDIFDDVYPLLAQADVLITDYSSVYFDFLLLDRPIIFFCFDYQEYIDNDRGFLFDYDSVTPGPKVYDAKGLAEELDSILSGKDGFREQRVEVNKLFNSYRDGFSERVVRVVLGETRQPAR